MNGYVEDIKSRTTAGLAKMEDSVLGRMGRVPWLVAKVAGAGLALYVAAKVVQRLRSGGDRGDEPAPVVPAVIARVAVVPESARAGSEERLMSPPRNQGLVGYVENGCFCVVGCAVRLEDWLVVPDHVRSAKPGSLELRSFDQKTRFDLSSLDEHFELVETDLLALELDQTQWSRCGLAKKRMLPAIPEQRGAYVSVVGAFSKGTTGTLSHHTAFGRVTFTGSTFQGYSGAVYMAGDCIAGIHTHGGTFNGGYSASYILSLLKFERKRKQADGASIVYEDSEQWLEQQYESGAPIEYDEKWKDLDDVRLRVGGRYHIVSRAAVAKTFGNAWTKNIGKKRMNWRDEIEEPEALLGEALGSLSGASSSPNHASPSAVPSRAARKRAAIKRLKERLACMSQPTQPSAE